MTSQKPLILTFGRFNPPTAGHKALIDMMHDIQKDLNGIMVVVPSHTQDNDRNPLLIDEKIKYLKNFWPKDSPIRKSITKNDEWHTIFNVLEDPKVMDNFHEVIICLGSDRVEHFKKRIMPYLGNRLDYASITFISPPNRDDSNSIAGISATKARNAIKNDDVEGYISQLPTFVEDKEIVYESIRVLKSRL